MRLVLHGGFGEKGRMSLAIESGGFRLLLDAGVKTSAGGAADYYPAISPAELGATDAIVVTHGHEDHAAALGWCFANGFHGRVLMTAETRRDALIALEGYAELAHRALFRSAQVELLQWNGEPLSLGPLSLSFGRAGHVAGGVWCLVDDARTRFLYCGDVVPASPVFAMDTVPTCDVVAIDASYGDDATSHSDRARQLAAWIESHPQGCVLPTPLYGRSLELAAIVPGALALAPGMREALCEQIAGRQWLIAGVAEKVKTRLDRAADWDQRAPLPAAALICHDGMGIAGPSRQILDIARSSQHPVLFTGHVPSGSPGERLLQDGLASWIRLPTHPTLDDNCAIVRETGARVVIGHSCEPEVLRALARYVGALRTDVRTGDALSS